MGARDSILAAIGKSEPELVDVPEWGATVFIKQFNVAEWLELVSVDEENRAWRILAASLQDENGEPVLSVDEIVAMPADQTPVILRLFWHVQRINGGEDLGEA